MKKRNISSINVMRSLYRSLIYSRVLIIISKHITLPPELKISVLSNYIYIYPSISLHFFLTPSWLWCDRVIFMNSRFFQFCKSLLPPCANLLKTYRRFFFTKLPLTSRRVLKFLPNLQLEADLVRDWLPFSASFCLNFRFEFRRKWTNFSIKSNCDEFKFFSGEMILLTLTF